MPMVQIRQSLKQWRTFSARDTLFSPSIPIRTDEYLGVAFLIPHALGVPGLMLEPLADWPLDKNLGAEA